MRKVIEELDREFDGLEHRLQELILLVPEEVLFKKPIADKRTVVELSVGGCVIRSAAMIEQAFLGLTRRLWDDPFEWTLPEKLSTRTAIASYISEVAATREKGMMFLTSDDDLTRMLPAPEKLRSIFAVLLTSLMNAEHYRGRAEVLSRMIASRPEEDA